MDKSKKTLLIITAIIIFGAVGPALILGLAILERNATAFFRGDPLFGKPGLGEFFTGFLIGLLALVAFLISFALLMFLKRLFSGQDHFSHTITGSFKLDLNAKNVPEILLRRADDRFLEYSLKQDKLVIVTIGLMALVIFAGSLLSIQGDSLSGFFFFIASLIVMVWINIAWKKHQVIVFDRMNGIVTLPGPFLLPKKKIAFENVLPRTEYAIKSVVRPLAVVLASGPTPKLVFRYGRYSPFRFAVWPESSCSGWSFFVQYMDKNWPLPRGTAFDPFRKEDFQRRRKAGFPQPKYPNGRWLTDEYCGYIHGTDKLKVMVSRLKVDYRDAYEALFLHIRDEKKVAVANPNGIVWTGVYKNYYVFMLNAPLYEEKKIFDYESDLRDCFLVPGDIHKKDFIIDALLSPGVIKYIPS